MTWVRGLLHVHSALSYDGHHSLPEIVAFARRRRYRFVGMGEHSNTLDPERVASYAAECRAVSREDCLVIPGIEFSCRGGIHLLGIGVDKYVGSVDPVAVARHVAQHGGVSVVAHPRRYGYRVPEELARIVDGIEVWNARYDGRFVPDRRCVALVRALRERGARGLAFGGQDLHQVTAHRHVRVEAEVDAVSEDTIVQALRGGCFRVTNGYWYLDSAGEGGRVAAAGMRLARWLYERAVGTRRRLATWPGSP